MNYRTEIAARVYRGKTIEAIHYGSIAVVDGSGRLTHYLGDPEMVTMMRSAIKPFQLLPLMTTGAADHFGFSPRQLAIMCGSHIGSDEHREVVLSNLALAGSTPESLGCGTHWPMGMEMRREYPLHDEDKDPTRHNCSGKHSGFLALARFLGDDAAKYLDPESKTQLTVKNAVANFCEYPIDKMAMGVDGCSAPNYPLSIRALARGFQKLATLDTDDLVIRPNLERIRAAMYAHPEMVSGAGRFDLALMSSFPNNALAKVGAESVEGIGLADPPLGIAVKIHDGNARALGAVVVEVLKQLGVLTNIDDVPKLLSYEKPEVRNVRDIVTGHVVPEFKLRKV
jgi:L-asparaginase II